MSKVSPGVSPGAGNEEQNLPADGVGGGLFAKRRAARALVMATARSVLFGAGVAALSLFALSLFGDIEWRWTHLVNGQPAYESDRDSWRIALANGGVWVEQIRAAPPDFEMRRAQIEMTARLTVLGQGFAHPTRGLVIREKWAQPRQRGLPPHTGPYGPEQDLLYRDGPFFTDPEPAGLTLEIDDSAAVKASDEAAARQIQKLKEPFAEREWRCVSEASWHLPKNPLKGFFASPIATTLWKHDPTPQGGSASRASLLLPTLAAGVFAGLRIQAALCHDRRRRHRQCPTCGYDLRATAGRCPECGDSPRVTQTAGSANE